MSQDPTHQRAIAAIHCHPALMAGIAKLFGFTCAPLAKARILELGSGCESHILALAAAFPEAQCMAVDVMQRHIALLHEEAQRRGLTNIIFQTQAQWQLESFDMAFDYIICPDGYSGLRAEQQNTLLQLISRNLAPGGVAYVCHKVLPGWRVDKPMYEAFNALIVPGLDDAARAAAARELADMLEKATQGQGAYGKAMAEWAGLLRANPPSTVARDILAPLCLPTTFAEFAASAASARLGYLGDIDVPSMVLKRFGEETAAAVRRRCGDNLVATQQMIDLLSGRSFRCSLLIHGRSMPMLQRQFSPDSLKGLHLAVAPGLAVTAEGEVTRPHAPEGRDVIITEPVVLAAVQRLQAAAPATCGVDDLCAPEHREALRKGLYPLLLAGAVIPFAEPL